MSSGQDGGLDSTTNSGYTPILQTQPTPVDDTRLVLDMTFFILAFFAFFAVLGWPRLFTRFSRFSEWTHGHFVYHSTKPQRRPPAPNPRPTISRPLEARYEEGRKAPSSDDDHTPVSHAGLARRELARDNRHSLPPHCRSWSGIFQRLSAALNTQLDGDLSIGRCIILTCYFSILLYASLYRSNPFQDYLRTGYVSTAQIPIIYALGTKNNLLGRCLSKGYEKVKPVPPLGDHGVPSNYCIAFTPAQLPPPFRRNPCRLGRKYPHHWLW